jgi:drug/metabolite transporter (DMT)-like permease
MNPTEWGLLIALSIVWGGSFFFNGIAVKALPALVIVACRVGLAATILNLVLAAMGTRLPLTRATIPAFLGMGLLNNVIPFTLIVWGQGQIASGLAAVLNATTPLFSVVIAHVLTTDDKMTGRRLGGVLCGILGVAVMVWPSIFARPSVPGDWGSNLVAQLAILGAAVSYGLAFVFGRRFRRLGVPPIGTACGQLTGSTVLLVPVALLVDRPWTLPMPGVSVLAAIIGLATLSTALAYVIYFRLLASAGATNLSLVTLLVPVSAMVLGATLLAEPIELRQLLGMGLIALGLAAIDGRLIDRVSLRFTARGIKPFT